jgi:hypothetical protein
MTEGPVLRERTPLASAKPQLCRAFLACDVRHMQNVAKCSQAARQQLPWDAAGPCWTLISVCVCCVGLIEGAYGQPRLSASGLQRWPRFGFMFPLHDWVITHKGVGVELTTWHMIASCLCSTLCEKEHRGRDKVSRHDISNARMEAQE